MTTTDTVADLKRYLIVPLAALIFGSACERSAPPPPTNEAVIHAFGMCAASPPAPAPLPHVVFWLDDSQSMAGYVAHTSAYETVVRRLIMGAVQAGYSSTVRGFSSPAAVPLESIAAVLQPRYYNARDTPLAAALDEIAQPRPKGSPEQIAVLVSDLIQDEKAKDSLAIAESLRKVSTRFPSIILYGFRSAFQGTYYFAAQHGKTAVDTIDGVGRPFYVLVLAPSSAALEQFEKFGGLYESLNDKTFGGQAFEPSLAPIVVDSVKWRTDPDPAKNEWFGAAVSHWRCGDGCRVEVHPLKAEKAARGGAVTLTFDVRATSLLPIVAPSRYQAEIRRMSTSGKDASPATDVSMTAEGDLANPSCTLVYRFPQPPRGQWEVYSMRIRAGDANLTRPKWMTDWSTPDDSRPESRDKTLNLDSFGDALVRAVSERAVFLEHVVELYRGD